jgi:hypothetical protein
MIVLSVLALAVPANAYRLKKSTTVTIKLKPLIVFTTGARKTSGITLHAAHILVAKNGGASGPKSSATAPTLEAVTGQRLVTLDATDTGTLGLLTVDWPDDANGVSVPETFEVVDANSWNSDFSTGEVDIYSYRGNAIMTSSGEANFQRAVRGVLKGTVGTDPNTGSIAQILKDYLTADIATLIGTPVASVSTDIANTKAAVLTVDSDVAAIQHDTRRGFR